MPNGGSPIRILVLSNFYPPHHIGGYELRCRSVVDGLRRRGHHVHVLTSCHGVSAAGPPARAVTRALHLAWGPPYPPEDLSGLLHCELADRRSLAATLRRTQPDVLDVWGMEFASQSLIAALLCTGVPVHLTLEDLWLRDGYARDPLCALTAVARRLGVEMPPAVSRLCCLGLSRPQVNHAHVGLASRALQDCYGAAGFGHPRCRVRLAGIDLSPFRSMPPPAAPPPFVIVSVGQLTAARGQADLIGAAARVASDEDCPWPLVVRIVGGGSAAYVSTLRHLATRHASHRFRTEFVGLLRPERVADFYDGAHLFVHTSHLPEGLPRVLMEAMAAGLPAISTNTGGQRDILADGRFGPLLPAGDPEALADAIREALSNLPEWQTRARQAREHAFEHYDIEAYVDGHLQDLTEAAAARPPVATPVLYADPPAADEIAAFADSLGQAAETSAATFDVVADPDGAWRLGVVLKRTGQLPTADHLLTRLHETRRDDPTHVRRATFHLGELTLVQQAWSRAADLLHACLAVAPDHAKAAFDLRHAEQHRLPDHLAAIAQHPAVPA
ncbi:MAG TPA: glycosyltransferase family 4 protein [Phycisphaerae bacterium]|nr:glycosyltransferase family 4 protein [Phycisphaerae bacterium]